MRGWQARFVDEHYMDGRRLHLWCPVGDMLNVAVGQFDTLMVDPAVEVPQAGIFLPGDCYQAIVDAVDPPAHKAEIRRLEDALRLEQIRVDQMLTTFLGGRRG